MGNAEPSMEQKSSLYQAAIRVKEMAPWEWMMEADVFGVQNPETDEIGFVSVMGGLGEHYSIAVYLGVRGLDGFWRMHSSGPDYPEEVLEIRHLQASFEDRQFLTKRDRDEIRELGLTFRGRNAWPLFRSYRPGYFPWYVEAHEAQVLTWALERLLEVAPRVREDPELLEPEDEELYLVQVAEEGEQGRTWVDRMMEITPPEPESIPIVLDAEMLEWLKSQPRSEIGLEIDFFLFPARIGKPGERPRCAYTVMVVEGQAGMVLGTELLEAEPTLESVYGQVPSVVASVLANAELVPAEVTVRSEILLQLLHPLADELGFELAWAPVLPDLDRAKEFMMGSLG